MFVGAKHYVKVLMVIFSLMMLYDWVTVSAMIIILWVKSTCTFVPKGSIPIGAAWPTFTLYNTGKYS